LLLLVTSSIQLFPISLVTSLDSSNDSSNLFRRDFLPSINDTLISQRSVVSGDGDRQTVFIPTGEIPVVPFRRAFSEYLLDKELDAGMAHRTRTGSRNSKVTEQQLATKQQPVPKQQLVVTQQPVAKQQPGAKNSEGVASTKKAPTSTSLPVAVVPDLSDAVRQGSQLMRHFRLQFDLPDSETPPVVAIKKARTSIALPNGNLVKVVVCDAAGKTPQNNMLNFPHRVQANVRTICPPESVSTSFVLGSGQIGFECAYGAIAQGAISALENQPNGVAGDYGVGIPYELAPYGPSYRALVDEVVRALNVHILNLAHGAVKNDQETDYNNGLIHRIGDNPAGCCWCLIPSSEYAAIRFQVSIGPTLGPTTTAKAVEDNG
jgi:hypothetical protein